MKNLLLVMVQLARIRLVHALQCNASESQLRIRNTTLRFYFAGRFIAPKTRFSRGHYEPSAGFN